MSEWRKYLNNECIKYGIDGADYAYMSDNQFHNLLLEAEANHMDIDADLMLDEVYAEVKRIRASRPAANFATKRLLQLTSNAEHLEKTFKDEN